MLNILGGPPMLTKILSAIIALTVCGTLHAQTPEADLIATTDSINTKVNEASQKLAELNKNAKNKITLRTKTSRKKD